MDLETPSPWCQMVWWREQLQTPSASVGTEMTGLLSVATPSDVRVCVWLWETKREGGGGGARGGGWGVWGQAKWWEVHGAARLTGSRWAGGVHLGCLPSDETFKSWGELLSPSPSRIHVRRDTVHTDQGTTGTKLRTLGALGPFQLPHTPSGALPTSSDTLPSFKQDLKCHLFKLGFNSEPPSL